MNLKKATSQRTIIARTINLKVNSHQDLKEFSRLGIGITLAHIAVTFT